MINVLVAVDFANLMGQLRAVGRKFKADTFREFLANPAEGRFLTDARVYAPLPHNNGEGVLRFHDALRHMGYLVVSKRAKKLPDGSLKCNLDGEMFLDLMDICSQPRLPDVVLLVTGDGDFAPLALRLRQKGIRVEVAGLQSAMANELRAAAQGFLDLTAWANTCEALAGAEAPELGSAENILSERLI